VRKRRELLITLVCLAVVAVVVGVYVFVTHETEPHYQGRALSQWLMIYYESDRTNHDPAQRPLAAAAITAIGTNALPQLLSWLRYESPAWHQDVARVLSRPVALRVGNSRPARATLYRDFHRANAAPLAFRLLGTNALLAIPELISMSQDASHPQSAMRAAQTLKLLTNTPAK
jgi:hypothetical protein